ncbi:MAG: efflux RND transporter permease subunit [Planctomycetota bacterium]|nr:efflux RND transporter permease subunit [Planctomycetota bacterium]
MNRIGGLVARHRAWAWCLVVVLSIAPGLGLLGIRLSKQQFHSWASEEQLSELNETLESFTSDSSDFPSLLVLECEDFFTPDRNDALHAAVAAMREFYDAQHVTWVGDIPRVSPFGPATPLLPGRGASASELREARAALLKHPLVGGQLLAKDGRTMIIGTQVRGSTAFDELRRTATRHLEPVGIRVRLTGIDPIRRAYRDALDEGHLRLLFTAMLVVLVLALIIFRDFRAIIVASSGPAVGVFWTQGLMDLFGGTHNELLILVPVMILVVGFTDSVHFVVDIRQQRAAGESAAQAAESAVRHVGNACLLTSLTTAIGFGSLMLADSQIIDGFGRQSAIGVLLTFVAVVLVVPLMSNSWFGRNLHRSADRDLVGRNMQRLTWLIDGIVRHGKAVSIAGIAATMCLGIGAFMLEPDDRLEQRIPNNSEAWQAMHHCDQELGGIRLLRISIQLPENADREQTWRLIGDCERLIQDEETLGDPISIRDWLSLVPGANRPQKLVMTRFLPAQYRHEFWNEDQLRTQVVSRMQDLGMRVYRPILDRLRARIAELETRNPEFQFTLTGDAIVEGEIVQDVVRELFGSLLIAAAIIFLVITAAYRSIKVGLLSLIPNIFPLLATASIRAAVDTSLDIASATSFAICLGIAVDDTIHFLTRYRRERAEGRDVPTAIRQAFVTVGSALVMTTVVMVSGFASVMTSQMPTHFLFASMACSTIGAALLGDLVILPALLSWIDGSPDSQ